MVEGTEPPPPVPPTFLKIPPGINTYVNESVKMASSLKTNAPKYIAFCFVFSSSTKRSYGILAIAVTDDSYCVLP